MLLMLLPVQFSRNIRHTIGTKTRCKNSAIGSIHEFDNFDKMLSGSFGPKVIYRLGVKIDSRENSGIEFKCFEFVLSALKRLNWKINLHDLWQGFEDVIIVYKVNCLFHAFDIKENLNHVIKSISNGSIAREKWPRIAMMTSSCPLYHVIHPYHY